MDCRREKYPYIQILLDKECIMRVFKDIKAAYCLVALVGSGILAFGLYHVHSMSGVTEGGVLGLTLLLQHWFHISPAVSGFVLNCICYVIGCKVLGRKFIIYSVVSAAGFSIIYKICEEFEPLWPGLYEKPLLAAVLGAIFVGVGVGMCVGIGGAPSGDDAVALSISELTGKKIQWVYLVSDLTVLALSISYIPVTRLIFSVITVILSGQIVGWVQTLTQKVCKPIPD